jgi:hypothetical protein
MKPGMSAAAAALLIACLLPSWANAQVVCSLGAGSAYNSTKDQRPSADAMQLASRAYDAAKQICGSSCPEVILYRNATASNLMLIANSGRAKIVYAPNFISGVYDRHGDAGVTAVISHELGHALDDSLGAAWIDKKWTAELHADAWAGCVLAKIDLKPKDLEGALAALEEHPSSAHPAWSIRLPAIRAGYSHCGGAETGLRYPR